MDTNPPAEPVVILINRSLNFGSVGRVTGNSGVDYGNSFYEEAYGAHVCRMPLSQWRECKKDVTFAARLPMRQWEVDIELPESPSGGEDVIVRIGNASVSELEAIVSGLGATVQAAVQRTEELAREKPAPDTSPSTSAPKTVPPLKPAVDSALADLLSGTKWFALVKMAKEIGIDPDDFGGCQALRGAILAKQGGAPRVSAPAASAAPPGPGEYFDIKPLKGAKPKQLQGGKTS